VVNEETPERELEFNNLNKIYKINLLRSLDLGEASVDFERGERGPLQEVSRDWGL
jgi:hypothetical protein